MSKLQSPEEIDWEWYDSIDSGTTRRAALADDKGGRYLFIASETTEPIALTRVNANGEQVWSQYFPGFKVNSAALLEVAGSLYGVLVSENSTGGHVVALDAATGETRWAVRLEGIGAVLHSKYSNHAQLRFMNNWLVVFGSESGGTYIEVLDPGSGRLLSNRRP